MPVSGKRLSYLLRHRPDAIGLVLDERGRASIDELLRRLERAAEPTSCDQLFTGLPTIEYHVIHARGAAGASPRTRAFVDDLVRHADAWKAV